MNERITLKDEEWNGWAMGGVENVGERGEGESKLY